MDGAVTVDEPHLRSPEKREVATRAHEVLRQPSGLTNRMFESLLAGLGTQSWERAIGQMAETASVSKSSVNR